MQTQLPCRLCADVANAVARAENLAAACDAILSSLFNTLLTESVIFQVQGAVCTRLAGRTNEKREQVWATHLLALPATVPIGLIRDHDALIGTYLVLATSDSGRLFLVIEEDWTGSTEVLLACAAVISAGLEAMRQREQARVNDRLLRRTYRLLWSLGRARGPDALVRAITKQLGDVFELDRVSLARYEAHEDRLRITASRGLPAEIMTTVSAQPGDWALGHVYQSGKPVIVDNPAELPTPGHHRARYRPGPFAVIPLIHNRVTSGVLAVTDKRERAPFTRLERVALRALAPVIGAMLSAADRQEEADRLRYAATVDSLTGLHNRSYLDRRLHEEVGRSRRDSSPVSVLMVDIDDFKAINDARGHAAGDAVLKHVGDVIRSAVRVFDVCARYGGDEFVVVMPNSDAIIAHACAERIRLRTAQSLDENELPRVTLSVGVATARLEHSPSEVLARADRALYAAKAGGKNMVRVDGSIEATDLKVTSALHLNPPEPPPILPYVLVADTIGARRVVYRQQADRAQLGMLLARDGTQALRILEQFGPPSVLVVDMTAPEMNGASLVEWFHGKDTPTRIVAFSRSVTLRRYLAASDAARRVVMLRPEASITAIEAAFAEGLARSPVDSDETGETASAGSIDVKSLVTSLAPKVRRLIEAGGVAVYVNDQRHHQMHSGLSWGSDALLARAHAYLPRVAERVVGSGESVLIGQVGSQRFPAADESEGGHSLVAVPIKQAGQVVGAVCAFDDGPLALADNALTLFERLGESQLDGATTAPPPVGETNGGDAPIEVPRVDHSQAVAPSQAPPRPSASEDIGWQPMLLERQRGEFEVARELARARREQRQLSVVLFDVSPNGDRAGHPNGTDGDALASVAETFVSVVRPSDLPIRWSGNELLLVLPGVASGDARAVAERVRAAMQASGRHRVAVSGGVVEVELDEQFGNVVNRARQRVMIALSRGHNRVS